MAMSESPRDAGSADSDVAEEHTHHWLIGDQDGPSSDAVCKECGEKREFSNTFVPRKAAWMTRSASPQEETPADAKEGDGP